MNSDCDRRGVSRGTMPRLTRAEWIDRLQRLAAAERLANPHPRLQASSTSREKIAQVPKVPSPE